MVKMMMSKSGSERRRESELVEMGCLCGRSCMLIWQLQSRLMVFTIWIIIPDTRLFSALVFIDLDAFRLSYRTMSRKDTVIIGLRMTFWELCCMNYKGHHRGPSNKFPLESVWHRPRTGSRHSLGVSFYGTSVDQLCLWRGREKHNRSVNP